MKRIYNYKCDFHGLVEIWVEPENREKDHPCPRCGSFAHYRIGAPTISLPGWCDTFPSASRKWEERHIKAGMQSNHNQE